MKPLQKPLRPIAPEENSEWKYKYTRDQRIQAGVLHPDGTPAPDTTGLSKEALKLLPDQYARNFAPSASSRRRSGVELLTLETVGVDTGRRGSKKRTRADSDDDEEEVKKEKKSSKKHASDDDDDDDDEEDDEGDDDDDDDDEDDE